MAHPKKEKINSSGFATSLALLGWSELLRFSEKPKLPDQISSKSAASELTSTDPIALDYWSSKNILMKVAQKVKGFEIITLNLTFKNNSGVFPGLAKS